MKAIEHYEKFRVEPPPTSLLEALGPEGFVRLIEAFGGIRTYIPSPSGLRSMTGARVSVLLNELHFDTAAKLVALLTPGGIYIRPPLARMWRAAYYRKCGLANPAIARKLGVTENAVDKLFARYRSAGYDLKRAEGFISPMPPLDLGGDDE